MTKIYLLIFWLGVSILATAQNNRYYVNQQAAGANTGLSWPDAFTDLQQALQIAQAGDEVWVAQGTYRPTDGANRNTAFEPKSGVQLYGGFAGSETGVDARDWAAHPTVLSGDIGVAGDSTDNSYNVMYLHQPDSNTIVDGLILRHGVADAFSGGAFDRVKCGGGLYIMGKDWEAYPVIRNCVFEQNTAKNYGGGAMVNGLGNGSIAPQFINCRFENNRALNSGGGLARLGASWVEREKDLCACVFIKNSAVFLGGALYSTDAERTDHLDIEKCQFLYNSGGNLGGGAYIEIGRELGADISFDSVMFSNNSSREGAALYLTVYGFQYTNNIYIKKCNFFKNYTTGPSNSRSVIWSTTFNDSDGRTKISNCKFDSNFMASMIMLIEGQSNAKNVEMFFENNELVKNDISSMLFHFTLFKKINIRNTLFVRNKKTSTIFQCTSTTSGLIENCFFYKNEGPDNAKFYGLSTVDTVFWNNCNFIENSINNNTNTGYPNNSFFYNSIATHIADKNSFLGSENKTYIANSYFDALDCAALPAHITCGPGIITGIDPLFVDPASGDFRLQACSPLVNAGNNAYLSTGNSADLAGRPRIRGGTVDIGAFETQGPSLATPPQATASCPGGASGSVDLNIEEACLPIVYAWQSGADSGSGLAGLAPGNYQFTVTDTKGQSVAFTVEIPVGDAPALQVQSSPVVCGDTLGGSASATLLNAASPFVYLWAGGPTDSLRSGLSAGAYLLTVTDAMGCAAAGTVTVGKLGNLDVDIQLDMISCHGAADGAFTVSPTNGKAPFIWKWDSGDSTATLAPLGPGTYQGTVTDALGCLIGWILPLGEPGILKANPFITNATDTASANGSVELLPSGGTAPYTAKWDTGDTGLTLDSLPSGIYSVTLTDAHGCSLTETVSVGVTSNTHALNKQAFALFPNPARSAVWLLFPAPIPGDLRMALLDARGMPVQESTLSAGVDRAAIAIAGLPAGVYWVRIGGGVRKLMVN